MYGLIDIKDRIIFRFYFLERLWRDLRNSAWHKQMVDPFAWHLQSFKTFQILCQ